MSKALERTKPLPGLEDPVIEEIRGAAYALLDARQRKKQAADVEESKAADLLELMHENKLRHYHDAEGRISIDVTTGDEKIKVAVEKPKAQKPDLK